MTSDLFTTFRYRVRERRTDSNTAFCGANEQIVATNLRLSARRVPSLARRVKAKFNVFVRAKPFVTPMAYPAPSVEPCRSTVSTTKRSAADCSTGGRWYQSTSESLTKTQSDRWAEDRIPSSTSSTGSMTSVTSSALLNNKARTSCVVDVEVASRSRPERSSDNSVRRILMLLELPVDAGSRAAVIRAAMLAVYDAIMTSENPQSAATVRRPAADRGSTAAADNVEVEVSGLFRVISIIVVRAHTALCPRPKRAAAGAPASSAAGGGHAVASSRSMVYRRIVVATKTTPISVQTDPDRGRTNCSGPPNNDRSPSWPCRTTADSRATSKTCVKSITSYLSGVMTSGPSGDKRSQCQAGVLQYNANKVTWLTTMTTSLAIVFLDTNYK